MAKYKTGTARFDDSTRLLLRLCARIEPDTLLTTAIHDAARSLPDWQGLVDGAETHGIAPLVYRNLKHAGVTPPVAVQRSLKGLALRHRRSAQIRTAMLGSILDVLEETHIPTVVLKGAALMNMIYPHPGLRPMRDLDILVDARQARTAHASLIDHLHFEAQTEHRGFMFHHHHLPTLSRTQDGLRVSVEVHTDALSGDVPESLSMDTLTGSVREFSFGDRRAYALGHTDMLRHLCHHTFEPADEIKLGSIADIIGYADQYRTQIDWERLSGSYPSVLNTLRCLHYVCPLTDELLELLGTPPAEPPADPGVGLPPLSHLFGAQASKWQGLRRLSAPPHWWMHVYYNVAPERSLVYTRWTRHPRRVAYWLRRRLGAAYAGRHA